MYLEMEQLAVIHFLDTAKFNAIVSLIRTNQAYNVSLSPVTGRPVMTFKEVGTLHLIDHAVTIKAELIK
jgi:hypothetical protein